MVTAHGAEELGLCPHGLAYQAEFGSLDESRLEHLEYVFSNEGTRYQDS